jgi:hypothetical protein
MRKLFFASVILVASCVISGVNASAQTIPFAAKDFKTSVFLGLPNSYSGLLLPPVGLACEYGIVNVIDDGDNGTISVGAAIDFGLNRITNASRDINTRFQAYAFSAFHYFFSEKFEGHSKGGYALVHSGWAGYHYNGGDWISLTGFTYYFNPSFALTVEGGYSPLTYVHAGVSFVF